jgi:hypothetical protein
MGGVKVLAALAAVVAGALAGWLLGAQDAPGTDEAQAVKRAAAWTAYPRSFTAAFNDAWSNGFVAGGAKGVVEGQADGRQAGLAEARRRAEAAATPKPVVEAEAPLPPASTTGRPPATPGDVLVVGDSLEVLTSPYLQRYLPGVKLTIEAHGGFSSPALYEVFARSFTPAHDVIVFDAGTNDSPLYPQILAGRLQAVASAVGDRCMVVPTIHSYVVNGVGDEGKNRVVRAFAASRPGTQTPDWQATVAAHPEAMQPDNLHPNAAGADLRARLIAEGVKACLLLQGEP